MKFLYYDCFAGISGDMNLGALIDLGIEPDYLRRELNALPVNGYELEISKGERQGIAGTRVKVVLDKDPIDDHDHHHHQHSHTSRTFKDIAVMIDQSTLKKSVKTLSLDIFTRIAIAEGKIHGYPPEEVHFHEVGAIDSIVDVVGAAICLDFIKPDKIMASPVQAGGGYVKCMHGLLPVPAPATAEILKGIPMKVGASEYEMTTPTGAAILAATVSSFTESLSFTPGKIGYGIGERNTEIPNVLRVFLWEENADLVEDVKAHDAGRVHD
jgi:uncharacterized protein (TIGR00299 family) protein